MNKSVEPVVSVLLPVFNGVPFLEDAIQSILFQTYQNFELLVIDDGSTDGSCDVITSFSDSRIVSITNIKNMGLSHSLNVGIERSSGEFLARMDADDVALPDRFMRQLEYLQEHPDVAVCGTWMEAFEEGRKIVWEVPEYHDDIVSRLIFESVLYHPTIMIRKNLFVEAGLKYSEELRLAQDYDLWSRCFRGLRFANVPEVLLRYRLHEHNQDNVRQQQQIRYADTIRCNLIAELGILVTDTDRMLHSELSVWRIPAEFMRLEQVHAWLLRLLQANNDKALFPCEAFTRVLAERWYQLCFISTTLGFSVFHLFYRSPLSRMITVPLRHHLVFLIRSVFKMS